MWFAQRYTVGGGVIQSINCSVAAVKMGNEVVSSVGCLCVWGIQLLKKDLYGNTHQEENK